jgi:hypothetical protein
MMKMLPILLLVATLNVFASGRAAAQSKIGTVNMHRVLQAMPQTLEQKELMRKFVWDKQQELMRFHDQIVLAGKETEASAYFNLQERIDAARLELLARERGMLDDLLREPKRILDLVATELGLDYVLNTQPCAFRICEADRHTVDNFGQWEPPRLFTEVPCLPEPIVVYVSKNAVDVTDLVLKRMGLR